MSKILQEVTTIVGEYKNKDGETKKRYQRIGSIIDTKNGAMLKLDVLPLKEGGWDGWAYLNAPKEEQAQPQQRYKSAQQNRVSDEDMPF